MHITNQLHPSPEQGKAFFSNTGFAGIGEVQPGIMASMDAYVEVTRKALAAPR